MSTIDKDKKTGAERAVAVKPPTDGPHSPKARKAIQGENGGEAAYVVMVQKREEPDPDAPVKEKAFYTQDEIRKKARQMLSSGKLTPQEKEVLNDILGSPSEPKKSSTKA